MAAMPALVCVPVQLSQPSSKVFPAPAAISGGDRFDAERWTERDHTNVTVTSMLLRVAFE